MAVTAQGEGDDGLIAGINVTPLVDVTLVLLVVFIVTARLGLVPVLPHDLPAAATAEATEVVLSVRIDSDGALRAEGRGLASLDELASVARKTLAASPELRVVVDASGDARHRSVIAVMDTLRQAGATRIGFAVPQDETASERP